MLTRPYSVFLLILTLGLALSACQSSRPEVSELDALAAPLTFEPEGESAAKDPEASGGGAVKLSKTGQRAAFKGLPAGTFEVSVVAKADEYQGWPVMRLYLNGEQLGEDNPVKQARFDGGAQRFGEAELKEGDTLEAEFTNDLYEGKNKDRNLYVDHLVLSPVGDAGSTPAPSETPSGARYVAPEGSDDGPGTLAQPFRTVQRCAEVVEAGGRCVLRAGTYRETIRPANSGTAARPIIFEAYQDEDVTVSGTDLAEGWTRYEGAIYQTDVALEAGYREVASNTELFANQVFVDGEMVNEARYPNGTRDLLRPELANGGLSLSGDNRPPAKVMEQLSRGCRERQ